MGKVSEMYNESVEELVGTFSYGEKEDQLKYVFERVVRALQIIGHRTDITIENEKELVFFLNSVDISKYLLLEDKNGYHQCIRHNCHSKMSNANFFKAGEVWMYKCFYCADDTAITQAEYIFELFRYMLKIEKIDKYGNLKYEYLDKYQIFKSIRALLSAEYNNTYYSYCREIIDYNINFIENLDVDTNLYKLVNKRKLKEIYKDFLEVAECYTIKQHHDKEGISFFASKTTLQKFYENTLNKKAPAELLGKITLLDALGFIDKVQASEISEDLNMKILAYQEQMNRLESINRGRNDKTCKIRRVGYIKEVNCFKINKYDEAFLDKAEEIATYIIENKIYNLTKKHQSIIENLGNSNKFEKEIEELIETIIKAIKKDRYVVQRKLVDLLPDTLVKADKELIVKKAVENLLLNGSSKNSYKIVSATNYILKTYKIKNNKLSNTTKLIVEVEQTEDEAFIKLASRHINKYLEKNSYILTKSLYKVVDAKCNKYSKVEKDKLTKKNISKILLINELKTIKCNKENIEELGIKEKCKCQDTAIIKR